MRLQKLSPDALTYNSLIEALARRFQGVATSKKHLEDQGRSSQEAMSPFEDLLFSCIS